MFVCARSTSQASTGTHTEPLLRLWQSLRMTPHAESRRTSKRRLNPARGGRAASETRDLAEVDRLRISGEDGSVVYELNSSSPSAIKTFWAASARTFA